MARALPGSFARAQRAVIMRPVAASNYAARGAGEYRVRGDVIYEGEFRSGMMHGEGRLLVAGGNVWDGRFWKVIRGAGGSPERGPLFWRFGFGCSCLRVLRLEDQRKGPRFISPHGRVSFVPELLSLARYTWIGFLLFIPRVFLTLLEPRPPLLLYFVFRVSFFTRFFFLVSAYFCLIACLYEKMACG